MLQTGLEELQVQQQDVNRQKEAADEENRKLVSAEYILGVSTDKKSQLFEFSFVFHFSLFPCSFVILRSSREVGCRFSSCKMFI